MKKRKVPNKKKKGFTLIELLAVIIIFGILMIIALPAVTKYILNSESESYVDTAKSFMDSARNLVNSGSLDVYDTTKVYYIPTTCLKTENSGKSPYGEFDVAYVGVTYNGRGFNYYWTGTDVKETGVKDIVCYDKLTTKNIKNEVSRNQIKTNRPIEGKTMYRIYNSDCTSYQEGENTKNLEMSLKSFYEQSNINLRYDEFGNLRYYGTYYNTLVNNYVRFKDDKSVVWRILGIIDGKVKLMDFTLRSACGTNYSGFPGYKCYNGAVTLRYYSYAGSFVENWENSSEVNELNTTYYDSLSSLTKKVILDHTWGIRSAAGNTPAEMYNNERNQPENNRWTGKVGSIYISDFLYSYAEVPTTLKQKMGYDQHWITPYCSYAWNTYSPGGGVHPAILPINGGGWVGNPVPAGLYTMAPTVYISSNVYIKSGSGIKEDPYVLDVISGEC